MHGEAWRRGRVHTGDEFVTRGDRFAFVGSAGDALRYAAGEGGVVDLQGRFDPKVRAYVKNHNLGLEVPYRYSSTMRKYVPDFVVLVDDGHGPDDLLRLVVEIKGYRREDAKEKKSTMETYWVPGVNHLGSYGGIVRLNLLGRLSLSPSGDFRA